MAALSPEEVLELIETHDQLADLLDGEKQALVTRGWDPMNAEQAAAALMIPIIHNSLTQNNQGAADGV